jgi:hypothetical protein
MSLPWKRSGNGNVMYVPKVAILGITVLAANMAAFAAPVPVTLVADNFNNLLGGSANPVGSPTITDMSVANLQAAVVSQAFTDNSDSYAYLYQVKNTGTTGNNVVQVYTCSPFFGASGSTTLGYLTANAPSGFALGSQTPYAASVDAVAGPTISFAFPGFLAGYAIDPGEWSSTLYVLSTDVPGMITGNLIDGSTGTGDVVGAVPEPATTVLLVMGGLVLLLRRRVRT